MAQTATRTVRLHTNSSMASFISQGGRIEMGTIDMGSDLPSTGGSITIGIPTVVACLIQPKDGWVFEYDSGSVFAYKQSSNVLGALTAATSSDISSCSNVAYVAWGWG